MNLKEQLANKYNDYLERKSLGLDGITVGIQERNGDTVEDSIYNKLYKNQIEINKLENKYIKENKEIDITKAAKRLTELNGKIEKIDFRDIYYNSSYAISSNKVYLTR